MAGWSTPCHARYNYDQVPRKSPPTIGHSAPECRECHASFDTNAHFPVKSTLTEWCQLCRAGFDQDATLAISWVDEIASDAIPEPASAVLILFAAGAGFIRQRTF